MAKNEAFGLLGKLAIFIIFLGCLAVIVGGVWLSRFSLFDPAPLIPICTFRFTDGNEYTIYHSGGGTTVGSSVGVYQGPDIESSTFHRWAYAVGDNCRVGLSGEFLVVTVTSAEAKHNHADTLVFDLGAKSDRWLSAKVLSQPISLLCASPLEQ